MQPTGPLSFSDVIVPFARTLLMLCIVLGLIYLTLHKGLGRLVEKTQQGKRVRVVERVVLDQKRSLYLVNVDGKEMLLGGGDGGVVHLMDTGAGAAPSAAVVTEPGPTLGERFTSALSRNKPTAAPVTTGLASRYVDPNPNQLPTSGASGEG